MFEKLKALEDKFNEINEKLMQPETVNNTSLYTSLMKEYKTLTPIVEKFGEYKKAFVRIRLFQSFTLSAYTIGAPSPPEPPEGSDIVK
jgi:protein subunit release factor A